MSPQASLPDGVSIENEGTRQFVTQRGYYAKEKFASCMFAALCSVLAWMGYRLPLARKKENTPPENFVHALHLASGAPLNEGTNIRHTKRALKELLPDADLAYGHLSEEELIDALEKGAAIRVTARLQDLPGFLQKHAGRKGLHAFSMIGTRICNGGEGRHAGHQGEREVFWLDPMGRPSTGYDGDFVPWSDVREHLRRRKGEIVITMGFKDAATRNGADLPDDETDTDVILGGGRAGGGGSQSAAATRVEVTEALFDLLGFRGRVGRDTPVLNPRTGEIATRIAASDKARCVGPTKDGKHFGILVTTRKVPGRNPKVLLVEVGRVERVTVQ
jgi:hypothetical protein